MVFVVLGTVTRTEVEVDGHLITHKTEQTDTIAANNAS